MVGNNFPILPVSMTAPVPLALRAGFVSREKEPGIEGSAEGLASGLRRFRASSNA